MLSNPDRERPKTDAESGHIAPGGATTRTALRSIARIGWVAIPSRVETGGIFDPGFLTFLKTFVDVHHSIYPTVPPQGIYFEALVERTFRAIHKPLTVIRGGGVNQPRYDIQFEGHRISLKTETGLGTKRHSINITKLCTTEREPWEAETLKTRAVEH